MHVRVTLTRAEAEVREAGDARPTAEVVGDVVRLLGDRLRGEDLAAVEAARSEGELRRALEGAGITTQCYTLRDLILRERWTTIMWSPTR